MFWVRTGLDKLKAWVSGEAGEYDWDEAHAKYLSFLTPGPFQRAVAGGDVELVREMLAAGEDPNQLDELNGVPDGLNAIECAMAMLNHRRRPEDADAVRDLYACIELCLDAGALPDAPRTDRENRYPPLWPAVEQGRPEFVRLLLSAGADPNAYADIYGNTILHHACSFGGDRANYENVRLLLAAGADYAAENKPVFNYANRINLPPATPFTNAVRDGYHRLWPLFLQAGAAIPDIGPIIWERKQAFNEERGNLAEAKRYEYLRMVEAAGGFRAYEKAHAKALAATLAKKFPAHIPEEIFPRVVAFWAHAGFYASAAAVAVRAAETNPRTNQGNWLRNLCGVIGA